MSYAYTGQHSPARTTPPGFGQAGRPESYAPHISVMQMRSPEPTYGAPAGSPMRSPAAREAAYYGTASAQRGLLSPPSIGAVNEGIRSGCKVRLAAGGRTSGVLGSHEVGLVIRVDGPAHIAPYKVRSPTGGEGWFAANDLVLVADAPEALADRALYAGTSPPGARRGGAPQKVQTLLYTLHVEPGEPVGMSCKAHNGSVVVSSIEPSSPAHLGGLTPGCVVTAVNGIPVSRLSDVKEAVDYLRTNQAHPINLQVEVDRLHSSHSYPTLEPTHEQLAHERVPTLRSLRNPMSSRYGQAAARSAGPAGSPGRAREGLAARQAYYSPPGGGGAVSTGSFAGSPRPASRQPSAQSMRAGSEAPSIDREDAKSVRSTKSDKTEKKDDKKDDKKADGATPDLQQCNLKAHNKYRSEHSVPAIKYTAALAEHAQKQADICLKEGTLKHGNTPDGEGQNIYFKSASNGPPPDADLIEQALKAWYDEISIYKKAGGGIAGYNDGAGHFTQVVWKATTHVGVAIAANATDAYVVCNYSPGGNIMDEDEFKNNVIMK
eukprot:TRINITY_DN10065_c0_g2_i1.p1 TRINITY_DN10065_c0_g2~~TRINITY_DN10065_c0_g2_i1.p1  ORF type:complete len:547 (+),score=159.22 TRINITY_DN10065_c0_g2_i1:61-1701(+)